MIPPQTYILLFKYIFIDFINLLCIYIYVCICILPYYECIVHMSVTMNLFSTFILIICAVLTLIHILLIIEIYIKLYYIFLSFNIYLYIYIYIKFIYSLYYKHSLYVCSNANYNYFIYIIVL